ncbi:pectinesterase inhibitor 2-like [Aegilops tauschii subsp. strangulata]|nr:putative invertase inhibitor [Aegilops tauschii subsp. strangulata]
MRNWQQALSCLALLLFILVSSSASTLDDTCKSVAARNKDNSYNYCILFFQANNTSPTTDKRGLVVIATKITRAEAANTRDRIDALMASGTNKKVNGCLSECRVHYTIALNWLEAAAKGIESGNLQDAEVTLSGVILGIDTCEEGFRKLGIKSLLAVEDATFTAGGSIALTITSML